MSNSIHTGRARGRRILVSGASIAGPTLAYWLNRYGFDVTVVERAPAVRSGGYAIDIRGSALGVIERMGLTQQVRAAHIASRGLTFVDARGATVGAVPIYALTSNDLAHDVELPRGKLTEMLYGLTRDSAVRYRFGDAIDALEDEGDAVRVRFASGDHGTFDAVIGADGLHSNTRHLVFGPEEDYNRYLGFTFNIFSMPNDLALSQEAVVHAEPGRIAGAFAVRDEPDLFCFLVFATDTPPFGAHADKAGQIARTARAFAGGGWQVPKMIDAMATAHDLWFDTVSQIVMPAWSTGRVALVGDAAWAPSFRAGQGTSMALVGAYVLAGELATHDDPTEAFAAYERAVRPYMEANQALARRDGASMIFPRTREDLEARNRVLAARASAPPGEGFRDAEAEAAHHMFVPRDYG